MKEKKVHKILERVQLNRQQREKQEESFLESRREEEVMFTHVQSVYFESSASHLPRNLFTWNLHASKACLGSIHGSKIQLMNLGREEESAGGGFREECSDVTLSNRSSCAVQVCELYAIRLREK